VVEGSDGDTASGGVTAQCDGVLSVGLLGGVLGTHGAERVEV